MVPEINSGQLVRVLRAEYLVDAVGFNRVRGLPLASEKLWKRFINSSGAHHERAGDRGGGRATPKYTKKDFESDQDVAVPGLR